MKSSRSASTWYRPTTLVVSRADECSVEAGKEDTILSIKEGVNIVLTTSRASIEDEVVVVCGTVP